MSKPIVKVEPLPDEQINTPKVVVDPEVDIVSCTNKGDFASNKDEDSDATEYSSSFADTNSDADNSKLSDAEVESEFYGDSGCNFDTFGSAFRSRNKKLTDHWRNFIRPVMWRCKWTELKLKEIESQALKYSKELAEYDKRKHMEPDHFNLEESGSKSLPFSSDQYRSKAKHRRKRKKVEDTTEIASYISHHHLFSYLEDKKSDPDGFLDDDFDNPVITDPHADSTDKFGFLDDPFFEVNEADASLEQLLMTIDSVQSKVHKLKGDVAAIQAKNASRFSSSENGDGQSSSAQSPATSAGIGDTASVGAMYNSIQHVAEFDFGGLVLPGSAVSSFGETTVIPDVIESTVSAADVTLQPGLVGDSSEHMVDIVMSQEAAETNEQVFENTNHHPTERLQEVERGEGEGSVNPVSIPVQSDINVATASGGSQEQSSLRSCINKEVNFPKNKRKRGERKAGSGNWSKKPDNQ